MRRLLDEEGLCLGLSSGINVAGAIRLAKELGLDVANVNGAGPRGRVVRRDVEAALQDRGAQPKAGTAVAQMPAVAFSPTTWRTPPSKWSSASR